MSVGKLVVERCDPRKCEEILRIVSLKMWLPQCVKVIPGTQVGTSFIPIFPYHFEVNLRGDRRMASADWSAVPSIVIYTATCRRSFLLSQDVRFAWRVVVKSSPLFALSTCGAVFHAISSVQQSAPRLCTTLVTYKLTDHSQLKHLFAYLWCVLYCHPACVTVSKHMAGRDITIWCLKLSLSYMHDNTSSHVRR